MPSKKSAGTIVFYRGKQIKYLLLLSTFWGFPKGGIKRGEDECTAALRETKEESGLEVTLLDGFCKTDNYTYQRRRVTFKKQTVYYIGRAKNCKARLSREHTDLIWLTFDQALERIEYKGGRRILRQANEFITRKIKR